MKPLILILLTACAQCSPVPAVAIEMTNGDTATLTSAEMYILTQCKAQGGCYVVTAAMVAKVVADEMAKAKTCRRDTI